MGIKKLSEIDNAADEIKISDEVIGVFGGKLSKVKASELTKDKQDVLIAGDNIIINNNVISVKPEAKEYGVCRDVNSHSPLLTRAGAAVGLEANVGCGLKKVKNDFDRIYPWSEMKLCTLSDDGIVTSYKGDANFIRDGSIGQVMVEIPKFYIKEFKDDISNKEYTYICRDMLEGYRLPQAYYDKNGDELEHIYIGAYLSDEYKSGKVTTSVSGMINYDYQYSLQNAINGTKVRGKNWHIVHMNELCDVIANLFMVEFATLDFTSVLTENYTEVEVYYYNDFIYDDEEIENELENEATNYLFMPNIDDLAKSPYVVGQEIAISILEDDKNKRDSLDDMIKLCTNRKVTNLEIVKTENASWLKIKFSGFPLKTDYDTWYSADDSRNGMTDDIVATSGHPCEQTDGTQPMMWRGIENLFCKKHIVVGGIILDKTSNHYFCCANCNATDNSLTDDYTDTGVENTGSGYICEFSKDDRYPWLKVPVDVTSTNNEDYCAEFYSQKNARTHRFYMLNSHRHKNERANFFSATNGTTATTLRIAYKAYE